MQTILLASRARRDHRLVEALLAFGSQMRRCHHRYRQRMILAELDHRMLADIGVTPVDRDSECNKRFWQP